MYKALVIANSFLRKARFENNGIRPMSLNYLCYLAYSYYAAYNNFPLFNEDILVSRYGPRIMEIYEEFRLIGECKILRYAEITCDENPFIDIHDTNTNEVLNFVWKKYKYYTPIKLATECNNDTSLWYKLNNEQKFVFSFEDVRDFYSKLIIKNEDDIND